MAASRPLVVAIVAIVLLVGVLGADAMMDRTLSLDVEEGVGWRTVAQTGETGNRGYYAEPMGYGTVAVDPNGTLDLRLRVDNGYAWAYREHFVVRVNGATAAEGDLFAPARSSGEGLFSLDGAKLFGSTSRGAPKPVEGGDTYVNLEVQLGGKFLYASFPIAEAS